MALHIECRFNKNSLLQCYFLAFLPAGIQAQHQATNITTTTNSLKEHDMNKNNAILCKKCSPSQMFLYEAYPDVQKTVEESKIVITFRETLAKR